MVERRKIGFGNKWWVWMVLAVSVDDFYCVWGRKGMEKRERERIRSLDYVSMCNASRFLWFS